MGIVEYLLSVGASTGVHNSHGKTPIVLARDKGHEAVVTLLQAAAKDGIASTTADTPTPPPQAPLTAEAHQPLESLAGALTTLNLNEEELEAEFDAYIARAVSSGTLAEATADVWTDKVAACDGSAARCAAMRQRMSDHRQLVAGRNQGSSPPGRAGEAIRDGTKEDHKMEIERLKQAQQMRREEERQKKELERAQRRQQQREKERELAKLKAEDGALTAKLDHAHSKKSAKPPKSEKPPGAPADGGLLGRAAAAAAQAASPHDEPREPRGLAGDRERSDDFEVVQMTMEEFMAAKRKEASASASTGRAGGSQQSSGRQGSSRAGAARSDAGVPAAAPPKPAAAPAATVFASWDPRNPDYIDPKADRGKRGKNDKSGAKSGGRGGSSARKQERHSGERRSNGSDDMGHLSAREVWERTHTGAHVGGKATGKGSGGKGGKGGSSAPHGNGGRRETTDASDKQHRADQRTRAPTTFTNVQRGNVDDSDDEELPPIETLLKERTGGRWGE